MKNIATIDGIFQLSDKPISIEPRQQYDKMTVRTVDSNAYAITMDNKDYRVLLNKNKDLALMGNIHIKTASQNVIGDTNPLRYYIYKIMIAEPGTINGEISGDQTSATVNEGL